MPRESPFRLPVKKRKVGTYRHTQKNNSTPWVAGLNCEYNLMLENYSWLCSEIINTCMKIIAKQFPHTPISGFQPTGLAGADPGGRTRRAPPLKLEKNMFFLRKIVIFHTKYPNIFRASLRNCKNYDFLA